MPSQQTSSPAQTAYSLHTLFNSTTHGAYGKGWSDACLFLAEKLAESDAPTASTGKEQP